MDDYQLAMTIESDNVDEERVRALNNILAQKELVTQGYNRRVKHMLFDEEYLIWKTIFLMGSKDPKFRKWSP